VSFVFKGHLVYASDPSGSILQGRQINSLTVEDPEEDSPPIDIGTGGSVSAGGKWRRRIGTEVKNLPIDSVDFHWIPQPRFALHGSRRPPRDRFGAASSIDSTIQWLQKHQFTRRATVLLAAQLVDAQI